MRTPIKIPIWVMEVQPRSSVGFNSEDRMNRQREKLTICAAIFAATVLGLAAPALAQESSTTPPPATGESPVARRGAHGVVGDNPGLGIGAAAFVSGLAGPQVAYDFGVWHVEGLLGFDHRDIGGAPNPPGQTTFDFGVSGWYHLHVGENSDFSVGGGFGFVNLSRSPGGSANATVLEPGIQVRAFITPNVALHGRVGISFVFGDDTGILTPHVGLGGELVNGFGFTYYFR